MFGTFACDKKTDEPKKDAPKEEVKDTTKAEPKEEVKEEKGCLTEIQVKEMPAIDLVGIKTEEGYGEELMNNTWMKASEIAEKAKVFGPETKGIGVYFDPPENPKAKFFAGFSVAPEFKTPKGLEKLTLEAGEYLTAKFEGPKADIKKAYDKMYKEVLAEKGLMPKAPMYEIWYEWKKEPFKFDIFIPVTKEEGKTVEAPTDKKMETEKGH